MPVLFRIPGIGYEVPGYGLALMIGFLLSTVWAAQRAAKSRANPDTILNCAFGALFGGVVGSRFMYVVHYWEDFANRGSIGRIILAIIDVRKGGLEVYGGLLTAIAVILIYLWFSKHSLRWYMDIMAPSAALGMAIGRIGCFLNGCCWGGTCDLPWAVRFPFSSPAAVQQWSDRVPGAALPQELVLQIGDGLGATPLPRETFRLSDAELDNGRAQLEQYLAQLHSLKGKLDQATDAAEKKKLEAEAVALAARQPLQDAPFLKAGVENMVRYNLSASALRALATAHPSQRVHPTQLYAFVALSLLALLLSALYWRRTRDGQVIFALFLIEPPTRWVLELLRADNPVDTAGFTISQFIAICMTLIGLVGLLVLQKMPPRSPRAVPWEEPPADQPPTSKKAKHAQA
jgi:phosphatidylglycerol:prolipoprotein diacylglycerol transferase